MVTRFLRSVETKFSHIILGMRPKIAPPSTLNTPSLRTMAPVASIATDSLQIRHNPVAGFLPMETPNSYDERTHLAERAVTPWEQRGTRIWCSYKN